MSVLSNLQQPPDAGLDALFSRVNLLLGDSAPSTDVPGASMIATPTAVSPQPPSGGVFTPQQPGSIRTSGISEPMVERLVLKYLYSVGQSTVRGIANQIKLPFKILEPMLRQMRTDKHVCLLYTSDAADE